MSLPDALDGTPVNITFILLGSLTTSCTLGSGPGSIASDLMGGRGLIRVGIDESLLLDICIFSFVDSIGNSLVGLLRFFHEHSLRQKLGKAMFLVPLVVTGKLDTSGDFLVALDLQFVVVGEMSL